jgi:hypothetical protein
MQKERDGLPIVFWFAVLWWMIDQHTPFGDYAFVLALALMFVPWLAVKFFGHALARQGHGAWLLILQVGVWFGLFLYFAPLAVPKKILLVMGVGFPLLFAGALARGLYERFPRLQARLVTVGERALLPLVLLAALVMWGRGLALLDALFGALLLSVLAALPLHYGWRLGEAPPSGDRDARFGSDETFRKQGMSDEW